MIQTVLFDLDGTLLDTAPDLAFALNEVLVEQGCATIPYAKIRPVVSHGGAALIRLGFNFDENNADFEPLRRRLLDIYQKNLSTHTKLFPGMEIVLAELESRGLKWGVVTNKPAWLTEPLLKQLSLFDRAACVISGDTLAQRKPHPAPLLHACELTGSHTEECVYIGDAERDIQAGNAAGLHTLVALFGYLPDDDNPIDWRADGLLEAPEDLLEWIDRT